jgi:hypothetical protein
MDFPAFLKLMQQTFAELEYSREAHYYARFRFQNQSPDDPQPKTYPILAREQGTIVGYEQIDGLLKYFLLSAQKFKDAYNAMYNLAPPPENASTQV